MLRAVRGHHIWPKLIGSDSIVVDAGAHRGQFSETLIRDYGCRCYLIEANPEFAAALKVFGAAGIVSGALAARDGTTSFHFHANPESGGIVSGPLDSFPDDAPKISMISLGVLMERFGLPQIDLLKLDIEGAEFELIEATPDSILRSISQITVEFHDFRAGFGGRDLYACARDRLRSLGFISCSMAFRTHGDVLFINADLSKISFWKRIYVRFVARFVEKAKSASH